MDESDKNERQDIATATSTHNSRCETRKHDVATKTQQCDINPKQGGKYEIVRPGELFHLSQRHEWARFERTVTDRKRQLIPPRRKPSRLEDK